MKIKEKIKNKDIKPLFDLITRHGGNVPLYDLMVTYLQCVLEFEPNDPPIDELDVFTTRQIFENAMKKFNIYEFANFYASLLTGNQTNQ